MTLENSAKYRTSCCPVVSLSHSPSGNYKKWLVTIADEAALDGVLA